MWRSDGTVKDHTARGSWCPQQQPVGHQPSRSPDRSRRPEQRNETPRLVELRVALAHQSSHLFLQLIAPVGELVAVGQTCRRSIRDEPLHREHLLAGRPHCTGPPHNRVDVADQKTRDHPAGGVRQVQVHQWTQVVIGTDLDSFAPLPVEQVIPIPVDLAVVPIDQRPHGPASDFQVVVGIPKLPGRAEEERLARLKANEAALARLEEIASSTRAKPKTVERLRSEYEDRIRQLRSETPDEESVSRLFSEDFEDLAREVLQTERDTVIQLRNEEAINDQALRRIQHDIDLAEARLHRPVRKSR